MHSLLASVMFLFILPSPCRSHVLQLDYSDLITFDMSFMVFPFNVNLVKISLKVLFGARDVPRQSEKFADVDLSSPKLFPFAMNIRKI